MNDIGPAEYHPIWDDIGDPPRHYDRAGEPISMRQWVALYETTGYRRIALTRIPRTPKYVSTIWGGLNYNLFGTPLFFESMAFGGLGEPSTCLQFKGEQHPEILDQDRYSTLQDAIKGHKRMARRWWHNRKRRRKGDPNVKRRRDFHSASYG